MISSENEAVIVVDLQHIVCSIALASAIRAGEARVAPLASAPDRVD